MKKYLWLLLLLTPFLLGASVQDMHKAAIARKNVAAAGGCTALVGNWGEAAFSADEQLIGEQYRLSGTRYTFGGDTRCIDTVVVNLTDTGGANFRAAIYANSGDAPSGAALSSSASTPSTAGDGNPEELSITITEVTLTASTDYWIVISSDAGANVAGYAKSLDGAETTHRGYANWSPGTWATDAFPSGGGSWSGWSKSPELRGSHS